MKRISIVILSLVFVVLFMAKPSADEKAVLGNVIDMIAGDIQTVPVHNLTRVSVVDPDVADISDAQPDKITLLAKKAGATSLFLWDSTGKHTIKVRVTNEDLKALQVRIQKLLDESGIAGISFETNLDIGKLVMTGELSREDRSRMNDVIEPYSENILNLVKEEKPEDLIEIDMQVIEISTTLEQNLGIQWSNTGTATNGSTPSTTGSATGISLPYVENTPAHTKGIGDYFKVGSFNRSFGLEATVNALLQEGKARLISKPRLVVISGKQASFLVGGEIPIQNTTTSASGGVQQSSTTYSQYGVNMTVTPTIRKGKVDVVLNVDIRDVDNSSSFSTNQQVAFITRTASTELLMDNKQTLALAGLIKYQDSVTLSEVPFLSKVPIVGLLFRDRNVPGNNSTEMVIILTPIVLTEKKIANKQLVMPTPAEREANEEVNAKYEHEPLPVWPAPKTVADNNLQTVLPEMTAYARTVQAKISNAIRFPQGVKNLSGTVKLRLHILRNGTMSSEEVMESSGSDILDQDALQAAKAAAPFNSFTAGMVQDDLTFTVPIVYNKMMESKASAEKVIASY